MKKKEVVQIGVNLGKFPPFVCRYSKFDNNLKSSLLDSYLWFSDPINFNDPFDCNIDIDASGSKEDFKKWMTESSLNDTSKIDKIDNLVEDKSLYRRINLETKRIVSEYGICCFSLLNDSIQMWSYYAGGHTGICLCYDLVQIMDERMTPFKVVYQNQYPKFNYVTKKGDNDLVITIMGVKGNDWKHEREIRIVSNYQGKNIVARSSLKSVIFGCKMKEKERIQILNILQEKYDLSTLTIAEAITSKRSFKLDINFYDYKSFLE